MQLPFECQPGLLAVNDGPLKDVKPLHQSQPNEPIEILRQRYEEDGYLFLKGLIPPADVWKTRHEYFNMMLPTGVLEEGTQPVQGIFNHSKSPEEFPGIGAGGAGKNGRPGGDKASQFVDLAIDAHYRQWYAEDFCRHPALMDFVSRFTGWESNTLGLRRSLLRNNIPGTKPIGVHYDQIFLRHGEPTSVTAWVPIGDIKVSGGGLIYLENGRSRCCHSELDALTVTFQGIPSASDAKKITKRRPRLLASQSRRLKMHSTTT
jgi:phytanoyl-CoA hydroxylase